MTMLNALPDFLLLNANQIEKNENIRQKRRYTIRKELILHLIIKNNVLSL